MSYFNPSFNHMQGMTLIISFQTFWDGKFINITDCMYNWSTMNLNCFVYNLQNAINLFLVPMH